MAQNVQSEMPPGRGKELIKFLQTTTLFKGLSDSEVKFFLSRCGRQRAKKFDHIIREEKRGEASFTSWKAKRISRARLASRMSFSGC